MYVYRHRVIHFAHRVLILFLVIFLLLQMSCLTSQAGTVQGPLSATRIAIRSITDNQGSYANGQVPRNSKLEISFQLDTTAANLQQPYDASPPAGVQPGQGVSVDGLFSADNWKTSFTQPGFYYQDYLDEQKSGKQWFYPSGNNAWKVRFSANTPGAWQYKLRAQDASGVVETPVHSFTVTASSAKGPIRVSTRDSRYFEYADGSYFPSLGYNMNFDGVSWTNPILDNQANFAQMGQNGIQLARIWLSQWAIFGSAWNPWQSIDSNLHAQYMPYTGLTFAQSYGSSDVSLELDASYDPCMFLGWLQAPPAVKANTSYRVRIRYKTSGLTGAQSAGKPYGLVAKTGGWLWDEPGQNCNDPASGSRVTPYQPQNTADWQVLSGSFNSGNNNFLPNFYLTLENTAQGFAYIDYVWIEEDLGNGQYGANILSKPWMAQHQYFDQRNSYAFDQVVSLAEQNGVYLRPVVLEKNDYLFQHIDYNGQPIADDARCADDNPANDPAECPGNQWFYGNWSNMTKTRWLQQSWWRYLQARWGYSSAIQSWELLNEGDPSSGLHYSLAAAFANYMHQFKPDDHLVSTSMWHSFPKDEFWANPDYAAIDFADIHQYIAQDGDPNFGDTAQATNALSMQVGARQPGGAGKPVIRGETGLTDSGSEPPSDQLAGDSQGVWLHNMIWGGINPGGLIESYFYEDYHIYRQVNGSLQFDFRPQYGTYYNFIKNIPLSNGNYQDVKATSSNPVLRVWGQKDLVNQQAHLWIQNTLHTWETAKAGSTQSASGNVSFGGLPAHTAYNISWWDTYETDPSKQVIRTDRLETDKNGLLSLQITGLSSDTAVQVQPVNAVQPSPGPTPSPTPPTPIDPSPAQGGIKTFLPTIF